MTRWDESQHPRRPAGDEHGGEWVGKLSRSIAAASHWAHYVSGRNLTDGHLANAREFDQYSASYERPATKYAAQQQGWIKPIPTRTEAELDDAVRAGGIEIFRGIQGSRPNTTAEMAQGHWRENSPHARMQMMRDGDIRYGGGIYINGIYFSVDERVATVYAGRTPKDNRRDTNWDANMPMSVEEEDSVARFVLNPDARIVEFDSPEYQTMVARFERQISDAGNPRSRDNYTIRADSMFAAAGIDAIFVNKQRHNDDGTQYQESQYIVLNPSALIMSEAPPGPWDTPPTKSLMTPEMEMRNEIARYAGPGGGVKAPDWEDDITFEADHSSIRLSGVPDSANIAEMARVIAYLKQESDISGRPLVVNANSVVISGVSDPDFFWESRGFEFRYGKWFYNG